MLLQGLMHAFLMFSSFQMPLQMCLTTQLVIIFILCLLCFLLCAVFSALSSAACTTAQYQASMQKWPNKLCRNHWAENSSEAYPGKSGNWRPKQNAISKLPRVRLRFTFEPGITLFSAAVSWAWSRSLPLTRVGWEGPKPQCWHCPRPSTSSQPHSHGNLTS